MNSKNTQPEIKVQRVLLELGISFKKHNKNLFGTPDITIPNKKIILNIKGCFWHQHGCINSKMPKSRKLYWHKKFQKNKVLLSRVFQSRKQVRKRSKFCSECVQEHRTLFRGNETFLHETLRTHGTSCENPYSHS